MLDECKPAAKPAIAPLTHKVSAAAGLRMEDSPADKNREEYLDRVLYTLSFLYKAMQKSFQSGGMGTELINELFKGGRLLPCHTQAIRAHQTFRYCLEAA